MTRMEMDPDSCDKERRKEVGKTWENTLGETWDFKTESGARNTEMVGVAPPRRALKGAYLQYNSHHILTGDECKQGNIEMKQDK